MDYTHSYLNEKLEVNDYQNQCNCCNLDPK